MSSPHSNAQKSEGVKCENTVGPGIKAEGSASALAGAEGLLQFLTIHGVPHKL